MNDSLTQGPYSDFALIPATTWLTASPPPTPSLRWSGRSGPRVVELGTIGGTLPWQWLVQMRSTQGWVSVVLAGDAKRVSLTDPDSVNRVTVRALNRLGVESMPVSLSLSDTVSRPDAGGHAALPPSRTSTRGRPDGR